MNHTAVFEDIRGLYKDDQHSVAKLRNVSLALIIFDDSTAAALNVKHLSLHHYSTNSQTAELISTFCKLWKLFNINTPNKGFLLKDDFSIPLTYNYPRFGFLKRVIDWTECWKALLNTNGKLSYRKSSTQDCVFLYVLSSFLQNDPLSITLVCIE